MSPSPRSLLAPPPPRDGDADPRDADKCIACGSLRLQRTSLPRPFQVIDGPVLDRVPAKRCKTCSEVFVDPLAAATFARLVRGAREKGKKREFRFTKSR